MSTHDQDDLWRDFPKTAVEFEKRFATEEACRSYWIEARWGGTPSCACCESTRVWAERGGALFECADCGHQTSLTSGTLLEKTKKPFKVWFRAIFEISARRNGISAKELQRIMGFGSYKTAWAWLHKLRAALVRSEDSDQGSGGPARNRKTVPAPSMHPPPARLDDGSRMPHPDDPHRPAPRSDHQFVPGRLRFIDLRPSRASRNFFKVEAAQ